MFHIGTFSALHFPAKNRLPLFSFVSAYFCKQSRSIDSPHFLKTNPRFPKKEKRQQKNLDTTKIDEKKRNEKPRKYIFFNVPTIFKSWRIIREIYSLAGIKPSDFRVIKIYADKAHSITRPGAGGNLFP